MSWLGTVVLASALAVDSCVVALLRGVAAEWPRAKEALVIGAVFGGAQGLMTVAGALGGAALSGWFARVDHWVAFGVLAALGVKLLLDARATATPQTGNGSAVGLVAAAIATSIDAAAAGFGFQLVGESVATLAVLAAVITGFGSVACYLAGKRIDARRRRLGLALGGVALIAIAINVLREHWDHV